MSSRLSNPPGSRASTEPAGASSPSPAPAPPESPKKDWRVRGGLLVVAIACGYWGAEGLVDEASPSSSGVLRMALPRGLPPGQDWVLQLELAEASLPELSSDATAGLSRVELTHVGALSVSPCPEAKPKSEPALSVDAAASAPTPRQPSCELVEGEDRGVRVETQPDLELGVTRLQLFRSLGPRPPALTVELIPLGPLSLGITAGKSLEHQTELVTWPKKPVDFEVVNDAKYGFAQGLETRVIASGVKGAEARANLGWRQAPATILSNVRLRKLTARLSEKSEFSWLDRAYESSHGELTITAPDLQATIGSSCDGKCIEVRYTAERATLVGKGIAVEQRGPQSRKFQAAAAVIGLFLGLVGLFL
jgi:hypothetical protein